MVALRRSVHLDATARTGREHDRECGQGFRYHEWLQLLACWVHSRLLLRCGLRREIRLVHPMRCQPLDPIEVSTGVLAGFNSWLAGWEATASAAFDPTTGSLSRLVPPSNWCRSPSTPQLRRQPPPASSDSTMA